MSYTQCDWNLTPKCTTGCITTAGQLNDVFKQGRTTILSSGELWKTLGGIHQRYPPSQSRGGVHFGEFRWDGHVCTVCSYWLTDTQSTHAIYPKWMLDPARPAGPNIKLCPNYSVYWLLLLEFKILVGSEIYTLIKYFERISCLKGVGSSNSFLHIPPVLAQPLKFIIQIWEQKRFSHLVYSTLPLLVKTVLHKGLLFWIMIKFW